MASKKKKAKAQAGEKKVFVLPDGKRYDVTGENGKYVFCGATQFRRARGEIVTEEVIVTEAPSAETEE